VTGPASSAPGHYQVPAPGTLNVDHVAHFVPHMDAAGAALENLGFTLTPFSAQSQRAETGGPLVPAGTGNRCVMLQRGYLEILTPTGETPVAGQLRAAIQRYVGTHLIAFGTAAPEGDHARLVQAGFAPLAPVDLQREIGTAHGTETARFTLVRVPPGTMPEGRVQFCQHQTPALLWQQRWLYHANRAVSLAGVILRVADAQEAAKRYARYTGLPARPSGSVWRLDTARGYLIFADRDTLHRRLGVVAPTLPWIGGHILKSDDLGVTSDALRKAGASVRVLGNHRLLVDLPPAVGGFVVFEHKASGDLHFD
jgi:hypothetical protein